MNRKQGERITELAGEKGKSVYEISKETGIEVATLKEYYAGGKSKMWLTDMGTLADYFDVNAGYLLGYIDNRK